MEATKKEFLDAQRFKEIDKFAQSVTENDFTTENAEKPVKISYNRIISGPTGCGKSVSAACSFLKPPPFVHSPLRNAAPSDLRG